MSEHIIFIFCIYFFIYSTIGFGEIFVRTVNKDLNICNIGYKGLIGFFFISVISQVTIFFSPHDYVHNIILHVFGLFGFFLFIKNKKNNYEFKFLSYLILIFLIGAYVYKNHDDFSYYHLTYTLNLSENRFIIGTGSFSHGFRTFSSLFYYHSILYLPYIKFYLFHIGPFLILVFFNFIICKDLLKAAKIKKVNFLFYYKILILIFVNIVFYRIGEHGTDRSAQILLLLIFLLFFDLIFENKNKQEVILKTSLLLILIFMASSMKAIYYMYLILIPIVLIKNFLLKKFLVKKNILFIFILLLSISTNLITNYFNTGCFLYPSEKTCIGKRVWSIPKEEVKKMRNHYEWWSKAGGGPGYVSELKSDVYIKNFNWVKNWINRHFFNKVSDTLLGTLLICTIVIITYKLKVKKRRENNFNYPKFLIAILLPIIFLIEWFLNHPAMRYGGYVLIALPLIIFSSCYLEKIIIDKKKLFNTTTIFILISISIFFSRNLIRINKEINFYNYDIISSPFFYVENIDSEIIAVNQNLKIYSPINKTTCWASKTPCSYSKKLKLDRFLGLNVVYKYD